MSTAVAVADSPAELLERVVMQNDLSKLSAEDRLTYYRELCRSLGLNPLSAPFEYIHLSGKLRLYAKKDCTDQLRQLHGISIQITAREQLDGVYTVVARATDGKGRVDESLGAVPTQGLAGEALANAYMKAETKSKRRVTLSICGLGMLDETEVDSISEAQAVTEAPSAPPAPPLDEWLAAFAAVSTPKALHAMWRDLTSRDRWETWSPAEQQQLTAAKDQAKTRLGL